jgi:hypothetical protein
MACVVASLASADALMLNVGMDVRIIAAAVAAAARSLAKRLITLFTFVRTLKPASLICYIVTT